MYVYTFLLFEKLCMLCFLHANVLNSQASFDMRNTYFTQFDNKLFKNIFEV